MSTIMLTEEDIQKSIPEIKDAIRKDLPKLAIARPSFDWQQGDGRQGVRITLAGESSEVLSELSHRVAERLSHIEGLTDVRSEVETGDEEVHVVVDRERARQYGFSTQQVAQTVSAAMRGQNLRTIRTPQGEVDLRLTFRDEDRRSLDDLRTLSLLGDESQQLSLAAVADLEVERGPQGIHREDRNTMIGVSGGLDGITSDEAHQAIRQVMDRMELPPGYEWGFGQRFRQEEQSQNVMLMNLLLALILIYLVMAALFESLIHPAAIWSSIVFAIIGVYWFFLATGTTFSVMAWIGVLILIGIVVNNGIVLIDHINQLRERGLSRREAVVQGGRDRMRPILMTAATTVLGLIPLCVSNAQIGGNGPPYYPMARAIVGGLAFSTLVTLIVLPSIYVMLDDLRSWSRRVVRFAVK
jgi:HAE1 family hydrophobic/amphiphilic exporter-1